MDAKQCCPKCGYEPRHTGYTMASGELIAVGEHEIDQAECLTNQLSALQVKYDRAVECLRKVEWVFRWQVQHMNTSCESTCPMCGATEKHHTDCELAAILKEAE